MFFFVNQVYSRSLSICQSSILCLALVLQASAELQSVSDFYSSRVSHPSSLISLTFLTDLSQQGPMLMFEAEPGWALGIHGNHGDPCPRCSSNWAPFKLLFYDFVLRWLNLSHTWLDWFWVTFCGAHRLIITRCLGHASCSMDNIL